MPGHGRTSALRFIAAETLVDALYRLGHGAPRFIHVRVSASLEIEPHVLFVAKHPKILLPKTLEIEILGQVPALEFYSMVDDLNWTCMTPQTDVTNGPRSGVFRTGGDRAPEDSRFQFDLPIPTQVA